MSTRASVAVAVLGIAWIWAGCGGDDGPTGTNSCGNAGAKVGSECASLADCGAGAQNQVEVVFCEHCVPRADTHFCEAGVCRAIDTDPMLTNISFSFGLPAGVTTAKSFTIASLNPIMADGTRVTCAALLSTCLSDGNGALNARNSRFNALPAGDLFMGQISADPGEERLLFVQLTTGMQGTGDVVAAGCTEGIDVVKGAGPAVTVDVR
ncbi:hypothetical protein L6R52_34865 [Myxococcota bacterium]|nr:hypothetical protein [Myxococcota bacterium]